MIVFEALLVSLLAEEPEYPLGTLRRPPIAEAASPFRLVNLRYSFTDDGRTLSSFETRVRVGGSMFVGGEVTGDRHGLFLDTRRIELGVSEENGSYEIEGAFRAPRFLVAARALRLDREWAFSGSGSLRISNGLEVLLGHSEDGDQSRFLPGTVEEFARTGELPPLGPPTRELRATSLGILYQRESHLEVFAEAKRQRLRTEAGFDLDVERYRLASLWNPARIEIESELAYSTTSGRLGSRDLAGLIDIEAEIHSHFLATASTVQRWEPGVLRFEEDYRLGLTFFGRRHRFPRRSKAAPRILELQRRANAYGYNERRAYDVDSLRRFRERLGISSRRTELASALDELYFAQVDDRNVPQIGFDFGIGERPIPGIDSRTYRAFVGVPWPMRWPFSSSEGSVEFLRADFALVEEKFLSGIRAVAREASLIAFLNREMSIAFRWTRPGITPDEVIAERSRPARFTVSFDYALGR